MPGAARCCCSPVRSRPSPATEFDSRGDAMNVERRAEGRDGVIAGADARAAGLSKYQVHRRRTTGRWRSVRRDVMVVVGAPPTWRQAVRATVIAAGDGIVASHSTVARLYGVPVDDGTDPADRVIEVLGPLARGVRMDGVVGHRSGQLPSIDVTTCAGIPCTTPTRLVLDLSGRLDDDALGCLIDELIRRRLIDLEVLRARSRLLRPGPGYSPKRLQRVLALRPARHDPGESVLEARIMAIILRYGFPAPVQQLSVVIGRRSYRPRLRVSRSAGLPRGRRLRLPLHGDRSRSGRPAPERRSSSTAGARSPSPGG